MIPSPRQRRIASILLLTALLQPGWAVAHVLVHHHEGNHHHAAPPAPLAVETPQSFGDHAPGDHGHLDGSVLVSARAEGPSGSPPALPSFVSNLFAPSVQLSRAAADGLPPWADPERSAPSHPRAPPHA